MLEKIKTGDNYYTDHSRAIRSTKGAKVFSYINVHNETVKIVTYSGTAWFITLDIEGDVMCVKSSDIPVDLFSTFLMLLYKCN